MGAAVNNFAVHLVTEAAASVLHDISDGGLAVAVAEICIASEVGAAIEVDDWRTFFSEAPHRVLAVLEPDRAEALAEAASAAGVPCLRLGELGGDSIIFRSQDRVSALALDQATHTYRQAIPRRMR
jgi:phosphoribosylformylglycinamidine synthase